MYGVWRRGAGIACFRLAFVPIERKQLDRDRLSDPLIRDPNNPIDRVLSIFDRDEIGTISPEASFVNMFTFTGAFLGALHGGIYYARLTEVRYRESNEATVYETQRLAYRSMGDTMTLSFGRGVVRYGIRYAIFCASLSGMTTLISKYRGKHGIMEYSIGGLVTGAIYKFWLGPKGMISGGFFGALIGTMGGICIFGFSKITGYTMDDVYRTAKLYFLYKDINLQNAIKVQLSENDILLNKFYPDGMGSMKHTLDDLTDIQSESELKFNKNATLKLPSDQKTSQKNVEKK